MARLKRIFVGVEPSRSLVSGAFCLFGMLLLCSSHLQVGPQPFPVIYVVANLVRGLLDRKRSERGTSTKLQRELENKTKMDL